MAGNVADGPTAVDGHAPDDCPGDGWWEGDAMEAGVRAAWCRGSLAAGGLVDAIALALRASSVRVWDAGWIVADACRVVDEHCCLPLAWMVA
jgi:hypothetical protein